VDFIRQHLTENAELKSGFVIVGQSQKLNHHQFFKNQGFDLMPEQFEHLKMGGLDLVWLEVKRHATIAKYVDEDKAGKSNHQTREAKRERTRMATESP
jgi:hypothetical protein